MVRVVITRKNNIQFTENGVPEIRDDGEIILKDPNMIGHLVRTHVISTQQQQEIDGNIVWHQGLIPRAEVYWENNRSPAPALEDPSDLFWIAFSDESEESDDEETDGENDSQEEYETDESDEVFD